ncbi:MAG: hypothetical protein ACREDF_11115 [Thermoplasmata archaeon]
MVDQWTLVSYTGIVAAVVMLVGFGKKLFPAWVKGKEPHLGLGLSVAIGVLSKLTIPGAFKDVHWMTHVIALVGAAFGAKLTHDHIINEIVKGKAVKILLVSILSFSLIGCCSSPAAKQAVVEIQDTHKIILPEYRTLVDKSDMKPDEKDRRKKLADSLERLTGRLKTALED